MIEIISLKMIKYRNLMDIIYSCVFYMIKLVTMNHYYTYLPLYIFTYN